jgi:hypothetical protein
LYNEEFKNRSLRKIVGRCMEGETRGLERLHNEEFEEEEFGGACDRHRRSEYNVHSIGLKILIEVCSYRLKE